MRIRNLVALGLTMLALSACKMRQGDFTLLSTKNVELSRVDLQNMEFNRNVEGNDGRFWFLIFPFDSPPNLEEAVDNCLEKGGGDFMTSAVVYTRQWSAILFAYEEIIIEGDVGNSVSGRAIAGASE